jgi:predicted RNA methylase
MSVPFTSAWSLLTYHQRMLRDRPRVGAFRDAIQASVRPGDIVLDIGTGTGILAFFACAAGAKRVYAVEEGPVIEIARGLADHNGLSDRIVFVEGRSTEIELPEQVDVVVTETLWGFGIGEGLVSWVADARRRFLRDGGRIIPQWVEPMVVPVGSRETRVQTELDRKLLGELDLAPLEVLLGNAVHQVLLREDMFIGDPVPLCHIELATVTGPDLTAEAELVCGQDGVLDGVGGWFKAGLAPGIRLSNRPSGNGPTSWHHALFPLQPPRAVTKGARISWRLDTTDDESSLTWSARVEGYGSRQGGSTILAVPLAAFGDAQSPGTRSRWEHTSAS